MSNPEAPCPEVLFRLLWDGGYQPVGSPLEQGPGQAILQFTPQTMMRLMESLTPRAVTALMLVIEHAYRPGQPVTVPGWSARWLVEHGMGKTAAEKAAAELEKKGYIRADPLPSRYGVVGRSKLGVVPGGLLGDDSEAPVAAGGVRFGLQWRSDDATGSDTVNVQVGSVSAVRGDAPDGVVDSPISAVRGDGTGKAVDNSISAVRGDGESASLRFAEAEKKSAQVRPGSVVRGDGASTPPTRSSKEEEEALLPPVSDAGGALARADLHRFLRSASLRSHLMTRRETVALALAGSFTGNREAARTALEFFDRQPSAAPEMDLAWWVVDLLLLDGAALVTADGTLTAQLKAKGAQVPRHTSDEMIAGLVASLVVAMDTQVQSWVRWIVSGLRRDEWHKSAALTGLIDALVEAVRLPSHRDIAPEPLWVPAFPAQPSLSPGGEPSVADVDAATGVLAEVKPVVPSGVANDSTGLQTYLARLREAVDGTVWEDDISFQTLLQNPGRQEMVLARYEIRRASGE